MFHRQRLSHFLTQQQTWPACPPEACFASGGTLAIGPSDQEGCDLKGFSACMLAAYTFICIDFMARVKIRSAHCPAQSGVGKHITGRPGEHQASWVAECEGQRGTKTSQSDWYICMTELRQSSHSTSPWAVTDKQLNAARNTGIHMTDSIRYICGTHASSLQRRWRRRLCYASRIRERDNWVQPVGLGRRIEAIIKSLFNI
jgi:hypothetical protein